MIDLYPLDFCDDENDELKLQHLMGFRDFCLDLFEEVYGRIPPEEENDPRFVKGLLTHT
jgi:hypothetical protein